MKLKTQRLLVCILAAVCCVSLVLGLVACQKIYDMSGVTFTDKTVEYNRQKQSIKVEGNLPEGVKVTYSYYSDAEHTKRVSGAVSVGTYYVVASFSGSEDYQAIPDMTATLTITLGNYDMSAVKFENKVVKYSGEAQTMAVTGTLPLDVKATYAYYTDAEHTDKVEQAVNVGTYYVVASFTGAEGYNKPADMQATLTISRLDLSGISFVDKEVSYTGEAQTMEITGTLPDALSVSYEYYSDENYTNKVAANNVVNAGVYFVKAIIVGKDSTEQQTLTAKLTIKQVPAGALVLNDKTVAYNGSAQSLAIVGDLPAGVSVKFNYYTDAMRTHKVDEAVDAGVYYVTATFQSTGSYVKPDDLKATLTITKVNYTNVNFTLKGVYDEGEQDEFTTAVNKESADVWYVSYEAKPCTIRFDSGTDSGVAVTRPTLRYFRTLNSDGTLADETATNNTVTQLGDTIYVQATFGDKNHNELVVVRKVTVLKKTFELSTFEDLKIMRAHIMGGTVNGQTVEPLERGFRKDVRYVLKNDIDCQGQSWTPVQIAVKAGITASVVNFNAFCSEFDGRGYTISNYVINSDSFDEAAMKEIRDQQIDSVTRIHLGFFGYANECEIHDVTFSDVSVQLDKTFAERDFAPIDKDKNVITDPALKGPVIYYLGIVVGRLDTSKAQAFTEPSDLYNITVKNASVNVQSDRLYVGGIIGIEYIREGQGKDNLFGRRDNLKVEDSTFYGSRTSGSGAISMGGLIGMIGLDGDYTVTPDSTYVVNDASVKNIKIGYDVEAYLAADDADKEALLPTSNIYVGAYFGFIPALNTRLNDCSLANYLLAVGNFDTYGNEVGNVTGLIGYKGTCWESLSKYLAIPIKHTGFTLTQDASWNNGVNGIYDMTGTKIDETNADNAGKIDWGTAV